MTNRIQHLNRGSDLGIKHIKLFFLLVSGLQLHVYCTNNEHVMLTVKKNTAHLKVFLKDKP